eukprot:CAMPEP_0184721286 /NCGR_PEP_ID=MMETSP0314-20130426/17748_1 /TAXON_ID=38298 /ORGANISM="Rhodella maculata, Strain CCMP 736" /LENGTH=150 /DNA_ID=CAMNT_0027185611 /DNA_START=73 /DNA_END=521 /DNA_ORIENTATION=-
MKIRVRLEKPQQLAQSGLRLCLALFAEPGGRKPKKAVPLVVLEVLHSKISLLKLQAKLPVRPHQHVLVAADQLKRRQFRDVVENVHDGELVLKAAIRTAVESERKIRQKMHDLVLGLRDGIEVATPRHLIHHAINARHRHDFRKPPRADL